MNTENNLSASSLSVDSHIQQFLKDHPQLTQEDIDKLNIPPRDEENYPLPDKKTQEEIGGFIFKLNLMASSLDLNLQSLIWAVWGGMNNFLKKGKRESAVDLAMALEMLRNYLQETKNPCLEIETPN